MPQVVLEATVLAQARGADLRDRLSSLAIERMLCLSTRLFLQISSKSRLFLRISSKSLTVNILCTHPSLRNNPSKAKQSIQGERVGHVAVVPLSMSMGESGAGRIAVAPNSMIVATRPARVARFGR
jgi:hypothetical protein